MQHISALQARYHFPNGMDDDMIERTFGGNDEYRRLYEQEKSQLMRAVMASDDESCRRAAALMLETVTKRQQQFFRGEHDGWAAIEGVFLALGGSAVWVQAQNGPGPCACETRLEADPDVARAVLCIVVPGRRWRAIPVDVLRDAVGKSDSENPRVK